MHNAQIMIIATMLFGCSAQPPRIEVAPAAPPAQEPRIADTEPEPVEVVVVDLDFSTEVIFELMPGEAIVLGVGIGRMSYLFQGEERLEHSFDDGVMTVNGHVAGLVVEAGRISEELVAQHGGTISAIRLVGHGESIRPPSPSPGLRPVPIPHRSPHRSGPSVPHRSVPKRLLADVALHVPV